MTIEQMQASLLAEYRKDTMDVKDVVLVKEKKEKRLEIILFYPSLSSLMNLQMHLSVNRFTTDKAIIPKDEGCMLVETKKQD